MAFRYQYKATEEAQLEITSFMNLMIVLVPVLLMSITFTQVSVHEVKLPDVTGGSRASAESQSSLEIVVDADGFSIYYPNRQSLVKVLPLLTDDDGSRYDFAGLSEVMQDIKSQVSDRRDIVVLADQGLDYQNLISTMDAVKSYRTVLATSVVEVELFPEISLGDAS